MDRYHECRTCQCQGGDEVQHWKIVDGSIPTYRDGEGVNLGGCVFLVILCMFVGGHGRSLKREVNLFLSWAYAARGEVDQVVVG